MLSHGWTDSNIDVSLCLTFLSGRLNRNSRSKRPGLLSAGSIESSLFVAPMTTISPRLSKPSIKASIVDTIELDRGKEVVGQNEVCMQIFRAQILFEIETILTRLMSQYCPNKQGLQTVHRPGLSNTHMEQNSVGQKYQLFYFHVD